MIVGASPGSSARDRAAHRGQRTRCSRCSVTLTAIAGSSATWCRHGSAASTSSRSEKTCAHDRQRSGQCSTTSSTCPVASSRRCLPSCPGWPPRLRPEPGRRGRGGAEGGSCEGGSDELCELRLSRSSSSATRASSRPFASTSSPIRNSSATAVSRSPSRIASASCRSTPHEFAPHLRVPARELNAYHFSDFTQERAPLVAAAHPCRADSDSTRH